MLVNYFMGHLSASFTAPPLVREAQVFEDVSIHHLLSPAFSIPCLPSGQPNGSVYWYRNGDVIIGTYASYNATSGSLTVEIPSTDASSVLGVYQCFAETQGGVAYSITRVFQTSECIPLLLAVCQ